MPLTRMTDALAMNTSDAFPGPSPASSAPGDVGDRATTFQAVEGGTEHRSGETLMVAAYAGLWALMMAWVFIQWTKQTAFARRLAELESAVSGATATSTASKPAKAPAAAEAARTDA
jgi:hypothetical protein